MAETVNVLIAPEKCSGCLRCQLACSYFKSGEKAYNLSKARIRVTPSRDHFEFDIAFHDDCEHCGLCAEYCDFGALTKNQAQAPAAATEKGRAR